MKYQKVKDNLEKEGFKVSIFNNKEEAASYINGILDNTTIGIGGSMTIKEMGLYDLLKSHNEVYWHWRLDDNQDINEIRSKAMTTEVYLSSANAIASSGEIINIDGIGNRISSIMFGHKKVFIIVGSNKITDTYDEAIYRAYNVAAPKNAQKAKKNTPCAIKGDKCYHCNSEDRICKCLTVFNSAFIFTEYEIVIIDEELGF